jgi:hypothetical protein
MNTTFKNKCFTFMAVLLAIVCMTGHAFADTQTPDVASIQISSPADFQTAVADSTITTITLTSNISITAPVLITHPVTIDGAGNTISFSSNAPGWHSAYVLKVYGTHDVIIKNITLTGGDAALLIDNATAALQGTVDVSHNEFGGIESSTNPPNPPTPFINSVLDVSGATLIDSTESYGQPTLWEDGITGRTVTGFATPGNTTLKSGQVQYYLNPASTTTALGTSSAQFKSALQNTAITTINLGQNFDVTDQLLIHRAVTINGNGNTISATSTIPSGGHGVLEIEGTGDVTINNLIEDGANGVALHGINLFKATGSVVLTTVTVKNNHKSGITNNGSILTVNSITTANNTWGGINVDQASDVTTPTRLTVTGVSTQTETGPAIWQDDVTKDVTVTDTNNQYISSTYNHDTTITGKVWALNASHPVVAVTSATQPVIIDTAGTTDAAIDYHTLVTNNATNSTATLPATTITSTVADVSIAAATVVTSSDATWNGKIALPTVVSNATVSPTVGNNQVAQVALAITLGSDTSTLTFDTAVKIVLPGQHGKSVGFSHTGGALTEIAATCSANAASGIPAASNECKIDNGTDLIVWTKHFTTFATYTVTAVSSGGAGYTPGVSGGSSSTSPVVPAITPTVQIPAGKVLGATSFNFTLSLKKGSHGDEVTQLQTRLNADGATLTIDGKFGPKTLAALKKWQATHKLVVDGKVGPKTRAALNA